MTRDETIGSALAKVATSVSQVAYGHWSFALANGTTFPASARVDGPWLGLHAPLHVASGATVDEWTLLEWNAELDGGVRFALRPDGPDVQVRADVPLEPDVDVARRIIEACVGFKAATRSLHGVGAETTGAPAIEVAAGTESLLALCRERWGVTQRGADHLAVDLGVPGAFHQAVVERRADGTIAASVPVLESTVAGGPPASATCRRALAVLLARTCGIVRMVRAVAAAGDVATPRFEVVYAEPCVAELTHGFAALSVACRLAAAEAAVLRHDDAIAQVYLQQWDAAVLRRAA